jgi:multiple sugar transport system permease protein
MLAAHAVLLLLGAMFMLPFLWMVVSSVKPNQELFRVPPTIIPETFRPSNYVEAVQVINFWGFLRNTAIYAALGTLGAVLSNIPVAYGFSRIRWRGRDLVFVFVLATMMLPFQVRMIPLYIAFARIGWLDSYLPLVVPTFFGNAFYIFMLRQFLLTLPRELDDAARIDGCSEISVFTRIVLPLSKPALTTVALFEVMFAWHDFLGPLIYIRNQESYTLSVGLQLYFTQHGAEWGLLMAAATMFTLPMVVIFFFAQRTFIEGITLTGIKG